MLSECRNGATPVGRQSAKHTCHPSTTLVAAHQLTAADVFHTHASAKKSESVMRVVTK